MYKETNVHTYLSVSNITLMMSEIAEFYKGRTIFVTGATGFVGKVLLEKLLRSCSGLKAIYLLIREKKGKSPEERIEQITSEKLFDRIKKEQPDFFGKLKCISGNLKLPDLGISSTDYEIVINEVSVIFHVGATVRFNESLKNTLISNLYATKNVVDLAKKIHCLQALVHVSTTYCNTHKRDIYEKVYPTEFSTKDILECLKWMDDDMLESIRPKLLYRHPNNYCFSKCLAEQLLKEEETNLPVVILRPSLIISTIKEPMVGWIDAFNGVIAPLLAYARGLLRTLVYPVGNILDCIPVDYTASMIIASAWDKAKKGKGEIIVYNCATSAVNGINSKELLDLLWKLPREYPSIKIYRYPRMVLTESRTWNYICDIYLHLLPAILIDVSRFCSGRKMKMISLYRKAWGSLKYIEYFVYNDWRFHADNFIKLIESMSETDKEIFDFDIRTIEWRKCIENFVINGRVYLLNEDPSNLPMARKRLQKLYYCDLIINALLIGGVLYFLPSSLWTVLIDSSKWILTKMGYYISVILDT